MKSKAEAKHGPACWRNGRATALKQYEATALVVETVNLNPKQNTYGSSAGKVTERFTRWDDKQIFYEFTVDDPTMFTPTVEGLDVAQRERQAAVRICLP